MDIQYRLRLLGTIQVEKEGTLMRDFESRKALALLGYLARQDQPVSRSQLAGLFWGEKSEARGRRNLSRELSQLSSHLPDCFKTDYHTVQFQPTSAYWVDTMAFEELVKQGGRLSDLTGALQNLSSLNFEAGSMAVADSEIQPEKLAEAVTLYRGDFLTGYFLDDCPEFETWLIREQESWRRQVTGVLETLLAYCASLGQNEQAEFYVRRWLELEPWQEEAHRYLMSLLARNGKRTAALAQYEICCRTLEEELAAEPEAETIALYERIRSGELSQAAVKPVSRDAVPVSADSLAPTLPPIPTPAPARRIPTPSTLFINRTQELAQISDYLDDSTCRLLTLVGPGGIGKTRLAIQAAWQAAETGSQETSENKNSAGQTKFSNGIYFIPLDSLSSAEFLVATIAEALNFSFYSGADPQLQLLNYLREKEMLLVLDNFEHLLTPAQAMGSSGAADLIGDILEHAPLLKLLVVSRERLNLQGERLLPIQGLSVPDLSLNRPQLRSTSFERDRKRLEAYSAALQLFLQRAQAVQPNFAPIAEEEACLVRVCQLTEGIPLAIELAAAWVRLLSCQEIVQEMEHNLDFLATSLRNVPERQRSLRAVFDYSWRLLADEERRVMRQLSVFRGGFQREAAKRVAGASLPTLLALLDKSLLHQNGGGRFSRHVLLWQYAAEKLAEDLQEKATAQDRHCDYFTNFLQERAASLRGGDQKKALTEISQDIDNVRLSWNWAISQGRLAAIEQALESLFHFYDVRSWFQEGAEAFGRAATSLADALRSQSEQKNLADGPPAKSKIVLAKLLARQGWFAFQLGQREQPKALLQDSLEILRQVNTETDVRRELVFPLNYLGAVHRLLGEYDLAKRYLQEGLTLCQTLNDPFGLSIALNILSQIAYLQGDYAQAKQFSQESLALKRQTGDQRGITFSLNTLGQVAYTLAEYGEAKQFFQESLAISYEIDDQRGLALCLNHLGDVLRMMKDYQAARQLYEESLAISKAIGNQWGISTARIRLGEVAYDLGELQRTKEYFIEALKMAMDIQALPVALDALGGMAVLLMQDEASERGRILEIVRIVLNHPASSRDNQDRAARLLAELEPQLSTGPVTSAQSSNETKSLEAMIQELLRNEKD